MPIERHKAQSLADFISITEEISRRWRSSPIVYSEFWFRGQRQTWDLRPSAYRDDLDDDSRYGPRNTELTGRQSALFGRSRALDRFMALAASVGVTRQMNEYEAELLAQHHGLPTRFLDWSANSFVALYFAVRGVRDGDGNDSPVVWMLNPSRLLGSGRRTLDPDSPTGLSDYPRVHIPASMDRRVFAQEGRFTHHFPEARSLRQLAEEMSEWSDFLAEICIKRGEAKELTDQLDALGFNEARMFPDLDGFARDTLRRWKSRRI